MAHLRSLLTGDRRSRWAQVAAVVSIAALAFTATAAATANTHRTQAADRTLTWALGSNPTSLWPPYYWSTSGGAFFSLVDQTVLQFGSLGQLSNQLVSSWKAVNPTTYKYVVGKNVKFSDGHPVTAADVAFSLSLHLDPKIGSQLTPLLANVSRISSSGNTVTVRLKKADSTWQFIPASFAGYVYEKSDYLKKAKDYGNPSALPIGTGPYKYASFQPNNNITLVRNPYWKGKKYPWDKIVLPIIPDAQARLLAIQSGQADGTFDVPSSGMQTWLTAPNVTTHTVPSQGWRGFSLDITDGPFKDVHVRRAIDYAIDKQGLVKALLYGAGQVSKCIVPKTMFRSSLSKSEVDAAFAKMPGYDYNLAKAKAELKQSAYPNGFSTTLNVPSDSAAAIAISQNVAQSLKQIGINVKLNLMPGGPRFQVILDHGPHLGMQILGMGPDYPSPIDYPQQLMSSSQAVKDGQNSANWRNSTVDKLINQAQATTDQKVAARNMLKVCSAAAQQLPYIPVFTFSFATATRKGLTLSSGLGPYYSNVIWLKYLSGK